MYMVHTMFRREFGLLPALARGVTAGDRKRLQIVADHIEFLATVMHAHHHSEDVSLWPRLLERGTDEVAAIVHVMEGQHTSIEKISAEVTAETVTWRGSATSDSSEALAGAIDRLLPVLNEHMSLEEQRILPIAEKYITAAEWDEMAGRIPPENVPLVFGMALYEGDPDVIENTLARIPPEVRSMVEELGPKAFAAHSELVHGTATPPRQGLTNPI
jgi:hemerythrin-like domain-containing protein